MTRSSTWKHVPLTVKHCDRLLLQCGFLRPLHFQGHAFSKICNICGAFGTYCWFLYSLASMSSATCVCLLKIVSSATCVCLLKTVSYACSITSDPLSSSHSPYSFLVLVIFFFIEIRESLLKMKTIIIQLLIFLNVWSKHHIK